MNAPLVTYDNARHRPPYSYCLPGTQRAELFCLHWWIVAKCLLTRHLLSISPQTELLVLIHSSLTQHTIVPYWLLQKQSWFQGNLFSDQLSHLSLFILLFQICLFFFLSFLLLLTRKSFFLPYHWEYCRSHLHCILSIVIIPSLLIPSILLHIISPYLSLELVLYLTREMEYVLILGLGMTSSLVCYNNQNCPKNLLIDLLFRSIHFLINSIINCSTLLDSLSFLPLCISGLAWIERPCENVFLQI